MNRWLLAGLLSVSLITPTFAGDHRGLPDGHRTGEKKIEVQPDYRYSSPEQYLPKQFSIDKPGKCTVECVREYGTGTYKCREYRC